jgi:hypothetical protein
VQPPLAFSDAVQAMLAEHVVLARFGVQFDLVSETVYLCQGDSFRDNVGRFWQGLGLFGELSGLQIAAEAAISPIQLTLSGLVEDDKTRASPYAALGRAAADASAEMIGRTASVFVMFFDSTLGQPVDLPYLLQSYQLGAATLEIGEGQITLSVQGDPLFGGKHIAPLNLVCDEDQQQTYPGDRVFERVGWRKTVITA